jgi:peptide deformylase
MPVSASDLVIVHYPAAVLRRKAKPIPEITDEVRAVAARMIELMRAADGIGLAAPQVGLEWRLFIVDIAHSDDPEDDRALDVDPPSATNGPVVYINPVFSAPKRDLVPYEEGCLSLPDIRGEVRRPSEITITATDLEGRRVTQRGSGLLARCWQHEMDHLDGVLILDRMNHASKQKNKNAVRSLEERGARTQ